MIPLKAICAVALCLLSACHGNTNAADSRSVCESIKTADNTYRLSSCEDKSGSTAAQFRGEQPSSPYATELDQATFIVAIPDNLTSLRLIAGFNATPSPAELITTKLVEVPLHDSIESRQVAAHNESHEKWQIWREDIQYFDPKGPGFPLTCATALRTDRDRYIAVAQCFDFGDMTSFFKLLDGLSFGSP